MDAVEYIKTRCRLCESKGGCSECPLRNKEDGRCIAYVREYAEKAVQIVEQWGERPPSQDPPERVFEDVSKCGNG